MDALSTDALKMMFDRLDKAAKKYPGDLTGSPINFRSSDAPMDKLIKVLSNAHGQELLRHIRGPEAETCINLLDQVNDVASGLDYLHSMKVVHGDLKGRNILIDDVGRACIADFGLAVVLRGTTSLTTTSNPSTPEAPQIWIAPELLEDPPPHSTKESDIYSLSMVVYEVFSERLPFAEYEDFHNQHLTDRGRPQFRRKIKLEHLRPTRQFLPAGLPEGIWELMQRCWQADPLARPMISEVLESLEVTSQ
ncbi:hypothetical protein AcV7_005366 [Taiwanofungus camphoratus]|nr:hypothetical protein AcV7_005366 [Antrodia cinnamomea]